MSNVRPHQTPLSQSPMSTAISFLPILLCLAALTAFVKLSAYLYKRTSLKWSHALVYVILFFILVALVGGTNKALGSPLPLLVGIALSVVAQVVVAGLYLGSRAKTKEGESLAFKRAAILGAVSYGTTAVALVVPALIYFAVRASSAA
jgi:hypothetical protein